MSETHTPRGRKIPVTAKQAAGAESPPAASEPTSVAAEPTLTEPTVNPYAVIADTEFEPRPEGRQDLVDRILNDPRMHDHKEGFLSCIQCGVCTSGCPAARFTEYVPREVARRALDGDETLLTDDTIWYCFYCYTCQSRCPRKNSVAVINQVVRSMQVESGYGIKHVSMFAAWGEGFFDKGMGGTPHVFFSAIADAWGPKWKEFIANRDAMREEMGLGGMYPSEDAVREVRVIMTETGFKHRLESLGAWGGKRKDDED
jgi:heterodisulfide reductase subunit C